MGSSTWSDKTTITNPSASIEFTDKQTKEIIKYLEEFQDQTWDISAAHFTKVFGFPVTAEQINGVYIEHLVG